MGVSIKSKLNIQTSDKLIKVTNIQEIEFINKY
jgi:hypothetical protein